MILRGVWINSKRGAVVVPGQTEINGGCVIFERSAVRLVLALDQSKSSEDMRAIVRLFGFKESEDQSRSGTCFLAWGKKVVLEQNCACCVSLSDAPNYRSWVEQFLTWMEVWDAA